MGFLSNLGSLPVVGDLVSSAANVYMQKKANEQNYGMMLDSQSFNSKEAEKNRAYQTEMANTAYQRQSADMQKAGINPMLAIMKSGGAATPSGSSASASSGPAAQAAKIDVSKSIQDSINTGLASKRLKSDIKVADTQATLNEAAEKTQIKNAELLTASAKEKNANTKILNTTLPEIQSRTDLNIKSNQFDKDNLHYNKRIQQAKETAAVIENVIGGLLGGTAKGIKKLWTNDKSDYVTPNGVNKPY